MPRCPSFWSSRLCWLGAGLLALPLAYAQTRPAAPFEASPTTPAQAEPAAHLHGSTLQRNGTGVRWRALHRVYALDLFLETRVQSLTEIHALPGPKRLQLTMLRDIDADELGRLFSRGVEANLDRAAYTKVIPSVLRLGQLFADNRRLQAGDALWIDWVPGTGTVLSVRGKPQGAAFPEPAFFEAMLSIWLGPKPVDAALKDALLGKPAAQPRPEPGA